jgi:succinate dehydrogenase / fumarate reductase cytochrome b subunit
VSVQSGPGLAHYESAQARGWPPVPKIIWQERVRQMNNAPSPNRFWQWFDPRNRTLGSWAFILNRITALGLSLYLVMHLFMLSKLAAGPEDYNAFIELAKTPVIKIGEALVIAAGLIHGLNGIRITLTSFGIGVKYQKQMFFGLMALAAVLMVIFIYAMFFKD